MKGETNEPHDCPARKAAEFPTPEIRSDQQQQHQSQQQQRR